MARIVVVGAGVVGLGTAIMLASDGHEVTVLERDPAPPPDSSEEAWAGWGRRGVNQFRLPHFFLSRYCSILDRELPQVAKAIEAAGGLRYNPFLEIPEAIRGPERPEDNDLAVLTGRRPVVEAAVAGIAAATPGLVVHRGTAVDGLVLDPLNRSGIPSVVGVWTETGARIPADLVVDMTGRRSPLPRWLAATGAPAAVDEVEDSGFMYYARHFRSPDGARPVALGSPLMALGTISSLTLAADSGTWSVVLVTSARDRDLYGLHDAERWEKVVRSLPLLAHWLDGEPIDDGVTTMAKLEDRIRHLVVDGQPVATGVVAAADAWACSNPSHGRGVSIGMLQGSLLRDCLREVGLDDAYEFTMAFHAATAAQIQPWFEWTRAEDRHRLAEIEAGMRGEEYCPDDPAWEIDQALTAAAPRDPDVLRLFVRARMVLELPHRALADPRLAEKVKALGGNWRDEAPPAPARCELVALATN